jgi:hypothetical protein
MQREHGEGQGRALEMGFAAVFIFSTCCSRSLCLAQQGVRSGQSSAQAHFCWPFQLLLLLLLCAGRQGARHQRERCTEEPEEEH